jgi:hypothetical protein
MARTYNIVDWQCARRTRQAGLGRLRCTSLFTTSNVHAPSSSSHVHACRRPIMLAHLMHACMHEYGRRRPVPTHYRYNSQDVRCFPHALLPCCSRATSIPQHRSTNQPTSGAACATEFNVMAVQASHQQAHIQ